MAERLDKLIAAERVLAADLPHRLRTPLTALRMNVAALGPGRAADDTRVAVDRLEQEIDLIIRAARRPGRDEPPGCDAAEVLRDRMGFWSALAEDQGRAWHLTGADEPAPVPVPRSDLVAVVDALLGNVFRHTPEGTEFAVTLHRGDGVVLIFFADAGPGIGDLAAVLRRGGSGAAAHRAGPGHRAPGRRVDGRRPAGRFLRGSAARRCSCGCGPGRWRMPRRRWERRRKVPTGAGSGGHRLIRR